MLVPLKPEALERLVPAIATYPQYVHCWGKVPDFLRRLSISIVAMTVCWLVGLVLGEGYGALTFMAGFAGGLYWFWAPIYWASLRNRRFRKYAYGGFWEGQVVDAFVTEEPIGREETVNDRGELVIVENRERRINVEIEDETGYYQTIQVPLKREHKGLVAGLAVQMVVFSDRPDLARILETSDLFIPARQFWVSDYPVLQREAFLDVADRVGRPPEPPPRRRRRPEAPRSPRREPPGRSDLALRRRPANGSLGWPRDRDDYADDYNDYDD